MTPEKIAALRAEYKSLKRHPHSEVTLATSDFDGLLETAEEAERLREQAEELRSTCEHVLRNLRVLCGPSRWRDGIEGRLRAAIDRPDAVTADPIPS